MNYYFIKSFLRNAIWKQEETPINIPHICRIKPNITSNFFLYLTAKQFFQDWNNFNLKFCFPFGFIFLTKSLYYTSLQKMI